MHTVSLGWYFININIYINICRGDGFEWRWILFGRHITVDYYNSPDSSGVIHNIDFDIEYGMTEGLVININNKNKIIKIKIK